MKIDPTTTRRILRVGDIVMVRSAHTNKVLKTMKIDRVSKAQKRVHLEGQHADIAFYYQQGSMHYRQNPGSGLAGSFLNDYFRIDDVKSGPGYIEAEGDDGSKLFINSNGDVRGIF